MQIAHLQLMVARVACQSGMVALDVQLVLVREAILVQEAHRGSGIPVILVLCWLLYTSILPVTTVPATMSFSKHASEDMPL